MSETDTSVPAPGGVPRTPLIVDHEAGVLRTGDRSVPVPPDGDALASYLSMIYAARGMAKGTRIPLRDEDLNVLAGLVGDDPTQVESRLIELMECTPEEARKLRALLFRRRSLATAAGIALGLAALAGGGPGSVRLQESSDAALGATSGSAPSSLVQLHDAGSGSVGPALSLVAVPAASSTPAPSSSPVDEVGAFVDDPIDGLAVDDGGPSLDLDVPASDTDLPAVLPSPAAEDAGPRTGGDGDTDDGDTDDGDTNGGDTNGGETNGGETNGGETNGGDTNGGDTDDGDTDDGDTDDGDTNDGDTEAGGGEPADAVSDEVDGGGAGDGADGGSDTGPDHGGDAGGIGNGVGGETGSDQGDEAGSNGDDGGNDGIGNGVGGETGSEHGGGAGQGGGQGGGNGNHYGTGGTDAGQDDQGDQGVAGSQGHHGQDAAPGDRGAGRK